MADSITAVQLLWDITGFLKGEDHLSDVIFLAEKAKIEYPHLIPYIDDLLDSIKEYQDTILRKTKKVTELVLKAEKRITRESL